MTAEYESLHKMATSLINKNFIKIFQNKILIARNYDRLSILSKVKIVVTLLYNMPVKSAPDKY